VLLHTRAVTICASDIHVYAEGNVGGVSWDRPFVPGHEAAAVVEDSNGTSLAPGMPVVVDPAVPCGGCDMCGMGNFHLCRDLKFLDLPPVNGAMRELFAWPAAQVLPLPTSLEVMDAPLIEPLSVAVHACELASSLGGATVLVAGCGAIGLLTLQVARVWGAKTVIATDPIPERLALAGKLGADVTVQVGAKDPMEEVMGITDGRGADVSFEAAGPLEALQQCLDVLRPGGEVVVIGIPSEDEYRLSASQLRRYELTMRLVRRQNGNFGQAISLARDGKVQLGPLLTHRFPVERVQEAFALAERKGEGAVRVAVTF
jgi:L-iditol 2-dehydrogenase